MLEENECLAMGQAPEARILVGKPCAENRERRSPLTVSSAGSGIAAQGELESVRPEMRRVRLARTREIHCRIRLNIGRGSRIEA